MRWNIKGFDQYEVDEAGQVWAKPQKRRFGNSCRLIPEKPLKLEKAGTWQMRKAGLPQRLRPDEIEQLKIAKGETDATHSTLSRSRRTGSSMPPKSASDAFSCSEPGTGVLSMASGSSDIGRTMRSSTYLSTSKACRS